MSTLKVDAIRHNSATSDAITTAADGTCTAKLTSVNGGQLSHRNKLINGAMIISQRGTSETAVNSSGYKEAPDRWSQQIASINSAFTVTQSTDSPDGFGNSYKIDVTTADTSLAAAHAHFFRQKIEGQNLQDFAFGTSSAKQLTVSFYVKTNKTGTYICELFNIGGNKQVSKSYTVSNTNWNRYSLTFPADTTTAITNDNANRFHVAFWLSAGSDYTSGTLNSSAFATNVQANRAPGQVNLHDSTDNEWLLTGVQLEIGTVATSFEHRSYGEELARCQRYYYRHINGTDDVVATATCYQNNNLFPIIDLPVTMRTEPSIDVANGTSYFTAYSNGGNDGFNTFSSMWNPSHNAVGMNAYSNDGVSGRDAGHSVMIISSHASCYLGFNAEL